MGIFLKCPSFFLYTVKDNVQHLIDGKCPFVSPEFLVLCSGQMSRFSKMEKVLDNLSKISRIFLDELRDLIQRFPLFKI